jgi:hypothetical protein
MGTGVGTAGLLLNKPDMETDWDANAQAHDRRRRPSGGTTGIRG